MIGFYLSAKWLPFRRACEGAMIDHAVSEIYVDRHREAVLLMGASNAFNSLNMALLPKNVYHLSRASKLSSKIKKLKVFVSKRKNLTDVPARGRR